MYDKTTIMQIAIIVIGIVITLYLGIKEKRKNEENINESKGVTKITKNTLPL